MTAKAVIFAVKTGCRDPRASSVFATNPFAAVLLMAGLLALTNCATAPTESNAGSP